MVELLEQVNHWHWLAFGLALLALELVGFKILSMFSLLMRI